MHIVFLVLSLSILGLSVCPVHSFVVNRICLLLCTWFLSSFSLFTVISFFLLGSYLYIRSLRGPFRYVCRLVQYWRSVYMSCLLVEGTLLVRTVTVFRWFFVLWAFQCYCFAFALLHHMSSGACSCCCYRQLCLFRVHHPGYVVSTALWVVILVWPPSHVLPFALFASSHFFQFTSLVLRTRCLDTFCTIWRVGFIPPFVMVGNVVLSFCRCRVVCPSLDNLVVN